MPVPDWEKFEQDCQEILGLHSVPGSGNQFYHVGDGVTGHHSENPIGIVIDAKTTIHGSYSLKQEFLDEWEDKAELLGKTFILPIRFLKSKSKRDYAVMELEDVVALLQLARKGIECL